MARFLVGPAFETQGEAGIDVERQAAALGMADHRRMHGILYGQLGIADAGGKIAAAADAPLMAEHVAARMNRAQPSQGLLQAIRQRVVGGVHAGEDGVAAGRGDLVCQEDRPQGRADVIAVIGMPFATDVLLVAGFLAHLGDHRMAVDRAEEAVDVDLAELLGEGHVLLGRQLLVAEEDHPVVDERLADLGDDAAAHRAAEIHAGNLRPESRGQGRDLQRPEIGKYGIRSFRELRHAHVGSPLQWVQPCASTSWSRDGSK